MTLRDEKYKGYSKRIQEDEVYLSNFVKEFEPYWIYKRSIKVTKDTIIIADIRKSHDKYNTLIIFSDGVPIVTKENSGDIIAEYQKNRQKNYRFSKMIIKEVFGKSNYLHAYMEKDAVFVPIEGESRGNVTYFNISYIDSVSSYSDYEAVISFCNYLDTIVPRKAHSVKRRLKTYLKHFIVYRYGVTYKNTVGINFQPFIYWKGKCYEEYDHLMIDVINDIKKDVNISAINDCRIINEIQHDRTIEEQCKVMEDVLDSH